MPYPLRYRCAYNAVLTSQVLRAFLRGLFSALRRRAKAQWGRPGGQCGAVTFIQRFGSALNLNLHFHTLALDGVYPRDDGTATRFRPLPPPSADEVSRVLAGTARRIARLLASRAEGDDDTLARDEPLLATLAAASLRTRIAMGPDAGQRWRRLGDRVEPQDSDPDASPRVPQHDGMSLHADVAVPARDRRRLERLCRYVARPPLAHDRLEARTDGRLALRLKTRWRDGTTHILMEHHELLERLVPLIPPPRAHQVRYHGVLAPCASSRDRIVPGPRPPSARVGPEAEGPILEANQGRAGLRPWVPKARCRADERAPTDPVPAAHANRPTDLPAGAPGVGRDPPQTDRRNSHRNAGSKRARPGRLPWAELLQHVFEVDALRCPRCGARMRLIAVIEDPEVARKILECLDLPARAPPPEAVPGESIGHDHDSWDEGPPWDFDQSRPESYGSK
ncbi:MAG: transposase [Myxococcota bacterium]